MKTLLLALGAILLLGLGGCTTRTDTAITKLQADTAAGATAKQLAADRAAVDVAVRSDAKAHDYSLSAELFLLAGVAVAALLYLHLTTGPFLLVPEGLAAASILLIVHAWIIDHTALFAVLAGVGVLGVLAVLYLRGKGSTVIGGLVARAEAWVARTEHAAVSFVHNAEGDVVSWVSHVTGKSKPVMPLPTVDPAPAPAAAPAPAKA